MLEYPRYDKRPACPLSTVFRTCHAVHNVQTVFALDPLPCMYVSFFIFTLRPTRSRTNVYINPPNYYLTSLVCEGPCSIRVSDEAPLILTVQAVMNQALYWRMNYGPHEPKLSQILCRSHETSLHEPQCIIPQYEPLPARFAAFLASSQSRTYSRRPTTAEEASNHRDLDTYSEARQKFYRRRSCPECQQ